jgi:hypothetical protein
MSNRHKHADLIHAWAEGATVQVKLSTGEWVDQDPIEFRYEARIKPEKKPDVVRYISMAIDTWTACTSKEGCAHDNMRVTFSGETGELISAEVLK